jgi:AraC-like DNA-binding protein
MRLLFDSATLPVPDRLEAWRSVTAGSMMPTEIDSLRPSAFTARFGETSLGTVQVTALSYTSLRALRSPRTIRISDPEYFQIGFIRSGRHDIDQNDTRAVLRSGDLCVYDSSQPFESIVTSETTPAESVILHFPKSLLPLSVSQVAKFCATPLPGIGGIGGLLTQFLVALADRHSDHTVRDERRLGMIAIDLTTAVLAHYLERRHPPLRSASHVLYLRVTSYIERNLHRADLGPATVAAAHRISLRYLHRIFQQHHVSTLNTHIRTRRIERARRDLIDPRFTHLTIASIAARWGFHRPADFSRAFLRHTGLTPRDCRNTG